MTDENSVREGLKDYLLLEERLSFREWQVMAFYLSNVAFAIHVAACARSARGGLSPGQRILTMKEDLRTLARTCRNIMREHGFVLPCVVVLVKPGPPSSMGLPDAAYLEPPLQEMCNWASDQDWHRGDFVLFVEKDCSEAEKRLRDVLVPLPPVFRDLQQQEPRSASSILDALRSTMDLDNRLLSDLEKDIDDDYRKRRREGAGDRPGKSVAQSPENGSLGSIEGENSSDHPVTRLTQLQFSHFRGFTSDPGRYPLTHDLITDADIVLLIGPNGTGKSSVLEAASLGLNGCVPGRKTDVLASIDSTDFKVLAVLRTENKSPVERTAVWSQGNDSPDFVPSPPASPLDRLGADLASSEGRFELNARLTTWLVEQVDFLFDEASSGHTLRDVFDPLPLVLSRFKARLEQDRSRLENVLGQKVEDEGLYPDHTRNALQEGVHDWVAALMKYLEPFAALPENLRFQLPGVPADKPMDHANFQEWLAASVRAVGVAAPARGHFETIRTGIPEKMNGILYALSQERWGEATRRMNNRLKDIESRLKRDRPKYDEARADASRFEPQDPGLPSLASILDSLAQYRDSWAANAREVAENQGRLSRLQRELEAVKTTEAAACCNELADWLRKSQSVILAYETLERECLDLREELERRWIHDREQAPLFGAKSQVEHHLRASQAVEDALAMWNWDNDRETRLKRRREDESKLQGVLRFKNAIDRETKARDELKDAFRTATEAVLRRFSFTGMPGLEVEEIPENLEEEAALVRRGYSIKLEDGRTRGQWSTGQRGQLAVAVMVAQNQIAALSGVLPHRVLMLDDVSMAYDLSNITREALLWRQLAFHDDERARRQILLSSHHEDLTQHLLDLLVPPEGRNVRVIRLNDWSKETGPVLEQFEIEPARNAALQRERNELGPLVRDLKECLAS